MSAQSTTLLPTACALLSPPLQVSDHLVEEPDRRQVRAEGDLLIRRVRVERLGESGRHEPVEMLGEDLLGEKKQVIVSVRVL